MFILFTFSEAKACCRKVVKKQFQKMLVEVDQEISTFLELNDAYLISIFQCLDTSDLIQWFQANQRFHEPIRTVLSNRCISISAFSSKNFCEFFDKCGDKIINLNLDVSNASHLDIEDIEYVIKYCVNVKNCRIVGLRLRKDFLVENVKFFKSLKSLLLQDVVIEKSDCEILFRVTRELSEIVFSNFPLNMSEIIKALGDHKVKVLGLQEEQENNPSECSNEENKALRGIEKLTVSSPNHFVPMIRYFPNIQKLVLHRDCLWDSLTPIFGLRHLKHLSLCCFSYSEKNLELFFSQLNDFIKLETLYLGITELEHNTFVESISKISSLEELQFDSKTPFGEYTLQCAHKLKQLRRFRFHDCEMIHRKTELNELALLKFINFAKKLNLIEVMISNARDICYDEIYEDLMTIVEYNREGCLHVNIIDKYNACNQPFIRHNEWLKMTVTKE